jgi:hypothetical protein
MCKLCEIKTKVDRLSEEQDTRLTLIQHCLAAKNEKEIMMHEARLLEIPGEMVRLFRERQAFEDEHPTGEREHVSILGLN